MQSRCEITWQYVIPERGYKQMSTFRSVTVSREILLTAELSNSLPKTEETYPAYEL